MNQEEKTQAPSERKIRKAREEGNVSRSQEVTSLVGLLVGVISVIVIFPYWVNNFEALYAFCINMFRLDFTLHNVLSASAELFKVGLLSVIPVFLVSVVAGVLGNVIQFGFLLSFKILKPKLDKINPVKGIKNVFSLKKVLDGFMITAKILVIMIVCFFVFLYFIKDIHGMPIGNLRAQYSWFYHKSLILVGILLIIFFIMATIDFFIKRFQYIKSLRMSKQEVKDEFRQQEGNQEVKAKIRQLMMKNSMNRMMEAIPTASVVVTNPTHYAVALRFDGDKDPAPVVVAKGIDNLAIRIKGIAREHGIHVIENPPLARELYRLVDVDRVIPVEMFEAVVILFHEVVKLDRAKGKVPGFMKNIRKF